jgi:flagellar M-ring protein FliF
VSKTLRHTVDPPGRVQKIAAAVLVDDVVEQKKDAKGAVQETRRKRTPEEMKQIDDLARAAIGFDAMRGDVLSVQNVSFVSGPTEVPSPLPITERIRTVAENWIWLGRYLAIMAMFAVIYVLVLRPVRDQLLSTFQQQVGAPAMAGGAPGVVLPGVAGQTASPFDLRQFNQTDSEVDRVVQMKKHLAAKVKNDPLAASQLVRHWVNEREVR